MSATTPAPKSGSTINKYGVPVDEWAKLSHRERDRHYKKFASSTPEGAARKKLHDAKRYQKIKQRMKSDKAFRKMMAARTAIKDAKKYWKDVEKSRQQQREKYRRNPDRHRQVVRESYYRHHAKHLERHRRRWAAAKSKRAIALSPDAVFVAIDKAVSKALPRFVRDDVISAMCLAVLEGQLFIENIQKEAKSFLASHNRMFDHFKTRSLDAPVAGADGLRLIDTLSDGAGAF